LRLGRRAQGEETQEGRCWSFFERFSLKSAALGSWRLRRERGERATGGLKRSRQGSSAALRLGSWGAC